MQKRNLLRALSFVCVFNILIIMDHVFADEIENIIKSAQDGDAESQEYLGEFYCTGQHGMPQNFEKALFWFEKAANQENSTAQNNLGYLYSNGKGTSQDYSKALYWFTKAIENGNADAYLNLGNMYRLGQGVPVDLMRAVQLFRESAFKGVAEAQYNLGIMYGKGSGVPQNYILAYAWCSIPASKGDTNAIKCRNIAAKSLSKDKLIEAQELSSKLAYYINNPSEPRPPHDTTTKRLIGSGTGFLITKDGYLFTCHHVIENASEISVSFNSEVFPAKIVSEDSTNDLALLKIEGTFPAIALNFDEPGKMGQKVFTLGYPNPDLQGVGVKYTNGTISSLTGFHDNVSLYQISVPVQPGNSGGPLVDENGNVLGIIVAMLDAKTAFKVSGSLPQNVNYAVKNIYCKIILDSFPEISNKLVKRSSNEINPLERVKASTVLILSYN